MQASDIPTTDGARTIAGLRRASPVSAVRNSGNRFPYRGVLARFTTEDALIRSTLSMGTVTNLHDDATHREHASADVAPELYEEVDAADE